MVITLDSDKLKIKTEYLELSTHRDLFIFRIFIVKNEIRQTILLATGPTVLKIREQNPPPREMDPTTFRLTDHILHVFKIHVDIVTQLCSFQGP